VTGDGFKRDSGSCKSSTTQSFTNIYQRHMETKNLQHLRSISVS
jgi:hypothetical protein